MKILKSKKGFTLIELIVTVAIMSITAGMGIAIFSSTLSNYSEASVTAMEQGNALEVETFIVEQARLCSNIYFIDSSILDAEPGDDSHYANNTAQIEAEEGDTAYLAMKPEWPQVFYKSNIRNSEGEVIEGPEMTITGVESIELSVSKQKVTTEETDDECFKYLNYTINMVNGYSIKGAVVMNNCSNVAFDYIEGFLETADDDVFTIGHDDDTKGVGFVLK